LRNRHVSASVSFFSERTQFLKIFALELEFRFQPIADLKRHIPIINICWQGWRCDGVFYPPAQQIIIQQGGGDQTPFPNMNKCIKDGGTIMCR
jgi:hypothetical protein